MYPGVIPGGLENLTSLKVLNLEIDLNLKNNHINEIKQSIGLPSLRRLLLADNKISEMKNILGLFKLNGLIELSLYGNPISKNEPNYKNFVIYGLKHLKMLESRKVSEEERRLAEREAKRDILKERAKEKEMQRRDEKYGNVTNDVLVSFESESVKRIGASYVELSVFNRLKLERFSSLKTIEFSFNLFDRLVQYLDNVPSTVEEMIINSQHNEVVKNNFLKMVILNEFDLTTFNGQVVSKEECEKAREVFSATKKVNLETCSERIKLNDCCSDKERQVVERIKKIFDF
ncbi:hypothetical protein O9G_001542 [Rozella allomycis CSF55]|uniref:U2 small nuclear ribonucleoprotein A' n=1 Tax=Rozella allomycis (strain CSF55) TaxID=988480 RepID=A0A075B1V7_ROZAC|nr:hypothetical protein O9G_001542 [Rozella allomycis CSF55]|eukprot:EPZ36558.1 hypothetical protein O9G_001542 [Rozella allomycis CSF55]